MSTVLFNPTNEDLDAQYIGETTIIPAGTKKKVDDKRARHILNVLGSRGLMTLDYGDEGENEKTKAEVGRRRNHQFKLKQVLRFNQQNEARQAQRLPYQDPTEQIADYAEEVGVPLLQPYRVEDESVSKIADLKKQLEDSAAEVKEKDEEVKAMKAELGEVKELLTKLVKVQEGSSTAPEKKQPKAAKAEDKKEAKEPGDDAESSEADTSDIIIKQFSGLSKTKLQDWVIKNKKLIPTYPEAAQVKLAALWKKFFKEDMNEVLGIEPAK